MTVRADIVSAAIWHGQKVSKVDAKYREGVGHCGICLYFNEDLKECRIVAGDIDANDGCKYFKRKMAG